MEEPARAAAMTRWVTVARTADLDGGPLVGASVGGVEVIVVDTGAGLRCVGATCTHAGCSLAFDGEVTGETITCGCHGSEFDLRTGAVVSPPADRPLPVYEVRAEGDSIAVAWPSA